MERYWHYFNSVVEKLFQEGEIRLEGSPLINIGVPLNQCMHSSGFCCFLGGNDNVHYIRISE